MATKYLLPCSCGKAVRVDASQAGDNVECECGQRLQVPSMRKLRELQPAPVDDAVGKPARLWTKREGIVFALGLFAALIGLGLAGYFQIGRLALNTKEARYDNLEEALQRIDQMDVSQLWDTWLGVREIGIGPYSPPQFVVNRHVASRWLIIIWVGLIVACLGIVTCIAAFMMRRSSKPASQPR